MEVKYTERGFEIIEFNDRYGERCTLQKSSLATEDAIWFGINDVRVKRLIPGQGWQDVTLPPGSEVFSRMHLTQDQVKELLPHLQRFAETGDLVEIAQE